MTGDNKQQVLVQNNEYIFEQIHLLNFRYDKLIDWSIEKLENGIESESILILASIEYGSNKELILEYFYKSLKEINCITPEYKLEIIDNNVNYLINAMNKGYISAISTLGYLVDLCIEHNYDNRVLPYYSLNDRIDLYIFENNKIFKSQTGSYSLEEYIRLEINKEFKK